MRIVLVNWAKVWDGAGYGGGVNGYCQSLALALRDRGHEVASLFGGTTFVPMPTPAETSECFIRRHDDWLDVRVFEVVNSPVMAPSIVQYQDPLGEVSAPALEREVAKLFALLKPDVVHFNNIEGFSIGCVREAKAAGARVVFSLHNYHTICPQVYLMQGHTRVCHDADNGHACDGCIKTVAPAKERASRAKKYGEAIAAESTAKRREIEEQIRGEWGGLKHEFTWPVRVVKRTVRLTHLRRELASMPAAEMKLPGHAVDTAASVTRPLDVPAPKVKEQDEERERERARAAAEEAKKKNRAVSHDHRGQTQGILDEIHWKPKSYDPDTPEHTPLVNVARPDPAPTRPANAYGERRAAMVEMLNSCDRVLAVSAFVRDKFVAMGVRPGVIEAMHIGSRIGRIIERNRELVFDPPAFERGVAWDHQRPVRLVFMGYNNLYKGLHVFADALELLTAEYLRRIDLSVFALDGQSIEWRFRRLEPRLAGLGFTHGYQYHDIPWMLGGKDLGVVPSVWWDNAPQTVFEFFSCGVPVLGAEAGGIPDFVKNERTGVLFRGNDPFDLARKLVGLLREPWRLSEMRAQVPMPKSMELHVPELERVYARGSGTIVL
jgi:glycosyltransferase involved in cell wall biosynthesis